MKTIQFKKLTIREWIMGAAIVVLIILLLKGYFGKDIPVVPETIPVKEQVKTQQADENLNKKISDSFNVVMDNEKKETYKWKEAYESLMGEYLSVQNDAQNVISAPVPDTCLSYQQKVKKEYDKVILANANKDKAAGNTIISLQRQVNTKDNFLKEKDRAYSVLKSRFDTCISTASQLEKYAQSIKPKRGIYAGAEVAAPITINTVSFGINLGYMNKGGTLFSIGAVQTGNTTQYKIGITTRIFKF